MWTTAPIRVTTAKHARVKMDVMCGTYAMGMFAIKDNGFKKREKGDIYVYNCKLLYYLKTKIIL
jgi:hypothetical protein